MKRRMIASIFPMVVVLAAMLLFTGAVYADAFDWDSDSTSDITFDAGNCPGDVTVTVTGEFESAKSSDDAVFTVNTAQPKNVVLEGDYSEGIWDDTEIGWDHQIQILPKGVGTATLTVKSIEGEELTKTITVEEEYFKAYLTTKSTFKAFQNGTFSGKPGILHNKYIGGDSNVFLKNVIGYGQDRITVYSAEGTKVKLSLKGKTYSATTDSHGEADLEKVKSLYKLGTKGTLKLTYGPATVSYSVKIVSVTKIWPNKIKAKAKKGKVEISDVHKGDVVKIKVGKKVVKTVKVKKSKYVAKFSFKSKKKMKKGTKITYIITNKYKQKLAKKTYKVGSKGNPWDGYIFY